MDKLLSTDGVKDAIRKSVNLDYLVPMLMKHGPLLTPLEFEYLCDRREAESDRIEYLIDRLAKKGDQVDKLTDSLKEEDKHTGHKEILRVVEQEIKNPSESRKRELNCCETDSSKRARISHLNGTNGIIKIVPDFTGRKSLLRELLKQLIDSNNIDVHCICGMPAVGKSQLAMAAGLELQQKLSYALTYCDFVGKVELDDSVDAIGSDNHCLILDNIDGLLCNHHQRSVLMTSLQQTLARYKNVKMITTSCQLYRDTQVTIKEVRALPFSNIESISYLSSKLRQPSQCPDRDFEPVVGACAGVPLALKCAVENIQGGAVDINDFHDSNEILNLLEVASYSPANQVLSRFKSSFSLLNKKHQKVLKEIAHDTNSLKDIDSKTKRSLYNSGWLEHFDEQSGTCALNALLHLFLKGISLSRDLQ